MDPLVTSGHLRCQFGTFGDKLGSSVVVEFDRWCVCLLGGLDVLTCFISGFNGVDFQGGYPHC